MQVQGPINRVNLGPNGRAYLWVHPTHEAPSKVVITAHGTSVADQSARAMPRGHLRAPRLNFYCRHGQSLMNEGLINYTSLRNRPLEIVAADQSYDYYLSKFTNTSTNSRRHNDDNETYDDISALLHAPYRTPSPDAQATVSFAEAGASAGMSRFMDRALTPYFPTDIISIAGRPFNNRFVNTLFSRDAVKLSDILRWLAEANYDYPEVHCSFCR